ncbi:MAG TPA: FecR/PupR family sigma factor regulator, partial [Caulobacteraceae bacterium]|nr:FecR/PupR family sigma factor regulator [Caulobacteraceae bacterium]
MSRRSAIPGHEPMPPMQAAAVWRMRRDGPDWSARDEAAFQAWLAEDDLHRRAFDRAGAVWSLVDSQAATPDIMVIRRDALDRAQRTARGRLAGWTRPGGRFGRRPAIAAAAAGFLVLAGLGAWPLVGQG